MSFHPRGVRFTIPLTAKPNEIGLYIPLMKMTVHVLQILVRVRGQKFKGNIVKIDLICSVGPKSRFWLKGDHNADVYFLYLLPRMLKFGLGIDFGPQSSKIDLKILSDQHKCHN